MTDEDAKSVVHAIFESEPSLPLQRRVVGRLQRAFPSMDWFALALTQFPGWDPDRDCCDDNDWQGWRREE